MHETTSNHTKKNQHLIVFLEFKGAVKILGTALQCF